VKVQGHIPTPPNRRFGFLDKRDKRDKNEIQRFGSVQTRKLAAF
jgi:hypothetical protein